MKKIFKKIIVTLLQLEAQLVLKKFKPKIIAITGSVGKTSTKDAIFKVVSSSYKARKSEKSFNSEIGVPLTILGVPNPWNNPLKWLKTLLEGVFLLILPGGRYPEWLILEIGADRPQDIKKITKWIKPDISVLTRLPNVPVHVEYFSSPDEVVKEKLFLIRATKRDGTAIFNIEDEKIAEFKKSLEVKNLSYGFNDAADFKASNYSITYSENNALKNPNGIGFKINRSGNVLPIMVKGALGIQHVFPILAAIAIAEVLGINFVSALNALSDYVTPNGRMKIVEGIRGSVIIDDTYNSSPLALTQALETLKNIEAVGKKIAVLGDMMELGKYSSDEHKNAGMVAASSSDILVTVGVRARGIADGAMDNGMSEKNIMQFDDSREAGKFLDKTVEKNDIVLIKGSQSMRMERVAEEIMAHPENKEELLVRQEGEWKNR